MPAVSEQLKGYCFSGLHLDSETSRRLTTSNCCLSCLCALVSASAQNEPWSITYFFIRLPTEHVSIYHWARLFPGGISILLTQPNSTHSETDMETESTVNRTDLLWLLVVGAVWGITNPFLKRRSTLSAHPEGQNLEADKEKLGKDSGSQLPHWKRNPFGCFCSFWRQLLTDWQVQFTSFGHVAIKSRAKLCAKPLYLSLHVCSSYEVHRTGIRCDISDTTETKARQHSEHCKLGTKINDESR